MERASGPPIWHAWHREGKCCFGINLPEALRSIQRLHRSSWGHAGWTSCASSPWSFESDLDMVKRWRCLCLRPKVSRKNVEVINSFLYLNCRYRIRPNILIKPILDSSLILFWSIIPFQFRADWSSWSSPGTEQWRRPPRRCSMTGYWNHVGPLIYV